MNSHNFRTVYELNRVSSILNLNGRPPTNKKSLRYTASSKNSLTKQKKWTVATTKYQIVIFQKFQDISQHSRTIPGVFKDPTHGRPTSNQSSLHRLYVAAELSLVDRTCLLLHNFLLKMTINYTVNCNSLIRQILIYTGFNNITKQLCCKL